MKIPFCVDDASWNVRQLEIGLPHQLLEQRQALNVVFLLRQRYNLVLIEALLFEMNTAQYLPDGFQPGRCLLTNRTHCQYLSGFYSRLETHEEKYLP